MGANEIEALGRLTPNWWSLVIAAAVVLPVLLPLFRREREKPHDPLPGVLAAIRDLQRDLDKAGDDRQELRRDLEDLRRDLGKVEHRQDLYQAIREMGRHHE